MDVSIALALGCARSQPDIYPTPTQCGGGESSLASVEGHVFADLDGDGAQDPGEPDLSGVSVDIVSGADSRTAVTDAFGNYGSLITAGDVTVDIDEASLPPNAMQSAGADPTIIVAAAGTLTDAGDDGYAFVAKRIPAIGGVGLGLLAVLLGLASMARLRRGNG